MTKATREIKATRATREQLVPLDRKAIKVTREIQAREVLPDLKEPPGKMVHPG